MFSIQKWCSWSLVATIASTVALVSIVHLFWFPMVPSFNYLAAREAQNSCVPMNGSAKADEDNTVKNLPSINLDVKFPADLHKAVVYHGAPWKAEIGSWLSGCDSITTAVKVIEPSCLLNYGPLTKFEVKVGTELTFPCDFVGQRACFCYQNIGGQRCKNDCNSQGICNHELGQCRCFHGYSGEGCSERMTLECNRPTSQDQPYGHWVVSICPAYCDTTRAMCFCGEGTKYPNRPVAEACGFKVKLPSGPGGPKVTDWTKADLDNIFTTNGSEPGWCNVDPSDAYSGKVHFKEECDCKYDGLFGQFCEVPVSSTCINQCSGHGHCRGGFCQCDHGWFGVDCSVPSASSSVREWPQWLRPAQINIPDSAQHVGNLVTLNAVVEKKRPLVYVYDLPPEFNSHLLEGRHFKLECVNRIYDQNNFTLWTDQLYGSQMAFYESILANPHRTLNGEEADFFFVPVLDACIITRADDAPHLSMEKHRGLRSSLTLEFYKKAYDHIVGQYPFWNHSSGRDHIWFFSWDEGACYAPKEIWNSMMLVHWGNTNSKHNHSTTAYWADNWDGISSDRRGKHPCFDPDKDLVLPAWKRPDAKALSSKFWSRPREERKTLFYFNGNLGPAYDNGRPEDTYSMGIRQKVAEEFGSTPNKEGKLGKQHAEDVVVTPLRTDNYHEDLASSVFCGVMPGDGWSGRMEDSILQGCIPVVIQIMACGEHLTTFSHGFGFNNKFKPSDGIYLPYENVLNYESFAVRIQEDQIPDLIKILRGFNHTEIEFRLANVQKIWQRFLYRDSILLEADRQKTSLGRLDDWAVKFLQLGEDDAIATVIQVLHYKLHNDPWRRQLARTKQEFGLPHECLIRTT